ncbi:hypothetical protein C8R47DRAFT_1082446 [Mycena vitilis]|nr:hypothetical protein C8R47DRAFT_1082446 [Mycena vitilis]
MCYTRGPQGVTLSECFPIGSYFQLHEGSSENTASCAIFPKRKAEGAPESGGKGSSGGGGVEQQRWRWRKQQQWQQDVRHQMTAESQAERVVKAQPQTAQHVALIEGQASVEHPVRASKSEIEGLYAALVCKASRALTDGYLSYACPGGMIKPYILFETLPGVEYSYFQSCRTSRTLEYSSGLSRPSYRDPSVIRREVGLRMPGKAKNPIVRPLSETRKYSTELRTHITGAESLTTLSLTLCCATEDYR